MLAAVSTPATGTPIRTDADGKPTKSPTRQTRTFHDTAMVRPKFLLFVLFVCLFVCFGQRRDESHDEEPPATTRCCCETETSTSSTDAPERPGWGGWWGGGPPRPRGHVTTTGNRPGGGRPPLAETPEAAGIPLPVKAAASHLLLAGSSL